jgi:hypothetical protein
VLAQVEGVKLGQRAVADAVSGRWGGKSVLHNANMKTQV